MKEKQKTWEAQEDKEKEGRGEGEGGAEFEMFVAEPGCRRFTTVIITQQSSIDRCNHNHTHTGLCIAVGTLTVIMHPPAP